MGRRLIGPLLVFWPLYQARFQRKQTNENTHLQLPVRPDLNYFAFCLALFRFFPPLPSPKSTYYHYLVLLLLLLHHALDRRQLPAQPQWVDQPATDGVAPVSLQSLGFLPVLLLAER